MKNQKNPKALRWIVSHTKKFIPQVVLLTAIGIISSFFGTWFFPLSSKWILDIATGDAEGEILTASALLLFLLIASSGLNIFESAIEVRVRSRIDISLKNDFLKTVISRKYDKVIKYHSGNLLNRLTSDVNVITNTIIELVPDVVSLITKLVTGLVLLFSESFEFSMILLVVGVSLFSFRRFFSIRAKKIHKQCQEADGDVRSYFAESLENLIVVKAFHANDKVLEKSGILQTKFFKLKIKRNTLKVFTSTLTKLTFSVTYYAALIWGAFSIAAGTITFGTLTAFLQIINQVQSPLKNASNITMDYYAAIASAERLIELEEVDGDLPVLENIGVVSKLVVKNVSFSYDDDYFPLTDFCMNVKNGEIVGLRGPSGIGKTTLFKLLMGFYIPNKGRIYLQTQDKTKLRVDSRTRNVFGFVPQGDYVFSGTIRENIVLGGGEPTAEILEICALNEFLDSLENGLDTIIGERGIGLSEGQIQRVVIARAIASGAQILLFDEFTSALDGETEQRIMAQIKKLGKTCIIISHKDTTLYHCDKVVEIGIHDLTHKN